MRTLASKNIKNRGETKAEVDMELDEECWEYYYTTDPPCRRAFLRPPQREVCTVLVGQSMRRLLTDQTYVLPYCPCEMCECGCEWLCFLAPCECGSEAKRRQLLAGHWTDGKLN